ETGIEGIWRYVNRLWRMVSEPPVPLAAPGSPMPSALPPDLDAVRRSTHKTIAAVTDDLDKFRFNRAVARIRELTNALEELPSSDAQGHGRPKPHRQYRRVRLPLTLALSPLTRGEGASTTLPRPACGVRGTVRRRVLLALGAPLALSGCGWAPLYGEPASGPA